MGTEEEGVLRAYCIYPSPAMSVRMTMRLAPQGIVLMLLDLLPAGFDLISTFLVACAAGAPLVKYSKASPDWSKTLGHGRLGWSGLERRGALLHNKDLCGGAHQFRGGRVLVLHFLK